MSESRETPTVDGLPVPWWDEHFFQDDCRTLAARRYPGRGDMGWCFDGDCRVSLEPRDVFEASRRGRFRKIIAAVAEIAWRKRAERYRMLLRIRGCFVGAWRCDVSPRAECGRLIDEAQEAVAACREWGEKT